MANELTQTSKFILYTSLNGDIKLDVFIRNETLWLTQKMMAELFDVEVPAVNKHLTNIFDSFELEPLKFEVMDMDGNRVDKMLIIPLKTKLVPWQKEKLINKY